MNQTNSSAPRDFAADICVGVMYLVVSSILLISYGPILYVILRDKSSMQKSCYKVMVSMGFADMIQLIGIGMVGGIFTLANSTGGDTCNRVWGSLINTCWLINCFQGNILAFNRFLSIWFTDIYQLLFQNHKTYYWLIAAYVYGVGINAMYISQNADLIYDKNNYIWYYNITDANRFCLITEITQDYVNEGMSLIFCLLIAVKLKQMRSATTANQLSKKDKAAIHQAVWISMSLMVYNCVYFTVVNVTTNKWAILIGNLLWIAVNGQSPTVFMVFNEGLRQQIKVWMGYCNPSPVQPSSVMLTTKAVPTGFLQNPPRSHIHDVVSIV